MTTFALTVSTSDLGLGVISGARVVVDRKRTQVADAFSFQYLGRNSVPTNSLGVATILLEPDDGSVYHEMKIFDLAGILVYSRIFTMPPQAVSSLSDLPVQDIVSASAAAVLKGVATATAQAVISTAQAVIATNQAGLATTNGEAQVDLAEAQVALATAQAVIATNQAGLATTNGEAQVDLAEAQVALATAQAVLTAADRVQTGLDVIATAADRVQTGLHLAEALAAVSVGVGSLAVQTLAALNAITTAPTNSIGYVTNDGTSANNGMYQWNGTVWTKSIYDPLTQAKVYADDLSAKNVFKVADAILEDPSKNLYNTTNDIANFYISDQSSAYAGRINALDGTAIHSMSVKAGETYLFYAPTLTNMLAVAFSKGASVVAGKQLTLAPMTTVSSSIKKVVVPAGMNYLFFNTKIPTLSFNLTASLVVNKFKGNFVGYGEADVTDEIARGDVAILKAGAVMGSDINSPDYFPNLAVDEIAGIYISAVGSVNGVGVFASYVNSAIQRVSVEPGKTYAIYSDNYNNTRFTVTASDSPLTTLGKQNTVLSLSDTSDPKVKTFTVPATMTFVFMTVYIQTLNFDMRSIIWVNEGQNSTKNVAPFATGIKGFQMRDPLAQERLDNLNILISSVLKAKKWIAIGDSITEKNIRADINYHDYINQDVGGMTVYNKGISGSGFHDRMNVADTLTEQADYITILWGTNDFGLVRNTYPLGTFLSTDTETISGRINTCLNALITKYPLAKIAIISALPRLTNYGSNAAQNSVGYTLKQHVDLLKQYAAHYSLPFLNLYEQSNLPVWIPAANQHYFTAPTLTTPDGLHPNDAGQRVMADKIRVFLESI